MCADEVVRLQPDLIFVISARLARAFQAATTTVPTVGITPDLQRDESRRAAVSAANYNKIPLVINRASRES
jgi:hypothetical protein